MKNENKSSILHPPPLVLLILNTVTYVFMVTMNALANVVKFNGNTNGSISSDNPTRFTPAGFAFSIWGLIFAFLGVFVIYSWIAVYALKQDLPKLSYFFALNMFINGMWSVVFAFELFWLAEGLMILMLATLIIMYKVSKKHVDTTTSRTEAPTGVRSYTGKQIAMYWCLEFPFALYMAWISVAIVAGGSIMFKDWFCKDGDIKECSHEEMWSIVMQIVVTIVSLAVCVVELEAPFPGVVAWALFAISSKNKQDFDGMSKSSTIVTVATILAIVNALLCLGTLLFRIFVATSIRQILGKSTVTKSDDESGGDI